MASAQQFEARGLPLGWPASLHLASSAAKSETHASVSACHSSAGIAQAGGCCPSHHKGAVTRCDPSRTWSNVPSEIRAYADTLTKTSSHWYLAQDRCCHTHTAPSPETSTSAVWSAMGALDLRAAAAARWAASACGSRPRNSPDVRALPLTYQPSHWPTLPLTSHWWGAVRNLLRKHVLVML